MNKFESQIHPINIYNIHFSRIDIEENNDVMINKIEFLDKNTNRTLVEFKMNFSTTKTLYRNLHVLKERFASYFILDIPTYNTNELCQIKGELRMPNNIWLILKFINTSGSISEFSLSFNSYEFELFLEYYFFYLLIDVVKTPLEK